MKIYHKFKKLWNQGLLWLVCCMVCLVSCASRRALTSTDSNILATKTDTLIVHDFRCDSVFIHDSINTLMKGDTIIIDRWHTKTRMKTVWYDSVRVVRDTIPVRFIVKEEVKVISPIVRQLAYIGGVVVFGILILISIKIFQYIKGK